MEQVYRTFARDQVTDAMLEDAARLFSENYGTWGEGSFKLAGKPVTLSARRLREQYLPDADADADADAAESSYSTVTVDGDLAGHAFVCRWRCDRGNVCWVTQLVVHRGRRDRGLARGLLAALRRDEDDIYGIMSSHPAACLATATAFGTNIEKVSLDFISQNADAVMAASPVRYIKEARLCGALSGDPDDDDSTGGGLVSGVDTGFFVDHGEPMEALEEVRRREWKWPLGGALPDGYEFLLVMRGRRPRRWR